MCLDESTILGGNETEYFNWSEISWQKNSINGRIQDLIVIYRTELKLGFAL